MDGYIVDDTIRANRERLLDDICHMGKTYLVQFTDEQGSKTQEITITKKEFFAIRDTLI